MILEVFFNLGDSMILSGSYCRVLMVNVPWCHTGDSSLFTWNWCRGSSVLPWSSDNSCQYFFWYKLGKLIYLTQEEKRLHLERQGMQSQAIRLTKDKLGIPCYVSGRSSDRRNDDFLSHTFLNTSVFEYWKKMSVCTFMHSIFVQQRVDKGLCSECRLF